MNNGVNNQNTNVNQNNATNINNSNKPVITTVQTNQIPNQTITQNPTAQQPTIVQQTTQPIAPTPTIPQSSQTATPVNEKKEIDLSNHPQNIINDNRDDSYKASQTTLNSIENPTNQTEEYIPNPDDMTSTDNYKEEEPPTRKKSKLTPILILIILGLAGYLLYTTKNYQNIITKMKYNCTPVTSYKEEKELDLNSTLVKDLYAKVYTNIKEDLAQPEWNNTMKLYLAYRQISDHDKYNSNCNMFNSSLMEPYTCVDSNEFTPKAFKSEKLELEWKKLFGEETPITLGNIKLDYACIGGYEYIPERGEYVEGYCDVQKATSFKMDKKLTKATTYRNTIILTENVKYHPGENMDLPEYLKSGEYIYTFRLDMNYNYVLISKVYNDKYNN